MGGGKKSLEISELGCADGCGREMGAENCTDGCGRRGCQGVAGNGWGEEAAGMSELGCADGCGWDGNGCNGVAGNGWGEEAAGDERAWLRGKLQMGNGCGELRGRLQTAWVQGSGWKWVGRRTRCRPRTRMLTRMLMDMQSLRTIFSNSLFEQSCIYRFPLLPVCGVEWTV